MMATFVDLFGAPGGMSLGFKMAGMEPAGAFDLSKAGIETYRLNFPEVPEENIACADLSRSDIKETITRSTSLRPGDVDVVIGGPPCQGFSTVGRSKIASLVKNGQRSGSSNPRFIDDERNSLYKSFINLVCHFRPSAVAMENVPGMISYRDGEVVRQICEDFRHAGYGDIGYNILNAADFGVPQMRRRIFFVAVRGGGPFEWPKQTHFGADAPHPLGAQRHVVVADALGDLPVLPRPKKFAKQTDSVRKYRKSPSCAYQIWARDGMSVLYNNITRWHRQKDVDVFRKMTPGGKWSQLPLADRMRIGYSNDSFDDKWKRLSTDRPSWTVTSHLSKDGYMYIHPTQSRTISVREAARLQSFPDSFRFLGSRGAQFRQIGNAVPPLLARALARNVAEMLRR